MLRPAMPRQRLAYAFLFLLCAREVAAARESFAAQRAAQQLGETLSAQGLGQDKVSEAGEFTLQTMWAKGAEDSLTWANASVTFRFSGQATKYVEVLGLGTRYRIMPDAVVLNQEIESMAVVAITGWQAYDATTKSFGPSEYSKEKALFFRTELNPVVGRTTSTWFGPQAGLQVHQNQKKDKKGEKAKMYVVNEKGVQKTVDADDVSTTAPHVEDLALEIPGYEARLRKADREIMAMVDGMLGETSCMGKPSKCAFRCYYDSVNDVCGPVAFCHKVGAAAPSALAPFGSQQKCVAVGGETPQEADGILAEHGIEALKSTALEVAGRLAASKAVSWSSSSRGSLKASVALWMEAAEVLNVLETLPTRLAPEAGNFPKAAQRSRETDMKHWHRRPDRLTPQQYQASRQASLDLIRSSKRYSVAAKLHGELSDFMMKRPSILMQYTKSESDEKCILSDKTETDKSQLSTFVKYFMKVPGYNVDDLASVNLDLPEHCQDFLAGLGHSDAESIAKDASQGERLLDESASFMELKSDRFLKALDGDASLLEMASDETMGEEVRQKIVIIASIIVGLVCLIVAGTFFIAGMASWYRCTKENGRAGGEHCLAFFVCSVCGGLVIFGAFAMSLVVGVGVLAGAVYAAHVASHYLQTGQRELRRAWSAAHLAT